jgi:deoxyribodipyrimidine photo-lyase
MTKNMRRDFNNRDELVKYLKEEFPNAIQPEHISHTIGGRKEAEKRLRKIHPREYTTSRNYLNGSVSHLSAYIRHGVMNLAEVRDYILTISKNIHEAEKFINELGWRDYWQRIYTQIGDEIWKDREEYKTGYTAKDYKNNLPEDILDAKTGLRCIDVFTNTLYKTGYLHNHARMYLASYIIHHRKIKWQAGARWFLQHLLDGDPASNNLSWQWVASTFSHKPYFFNRENLEKFTEGIYCRECPLYKKCPFEGTYEELEAQLFPNRLSNREDHR